MYGYEFTQEFKHLYDVGRELRHDAGREMNRLSLLVKDIKLSDKQRFCNIIGRIMMMNDTSMRIINKKTAYEIRIFHEIEQCLGARELKIANALTKCMQQARILPIKHPPHGMSSMLTM